MRRLIPTSAKGWGLLGGGVLVVALAFFAGLQLAGGEEEAEAAAATTTTEVQGTTTFPESDLEIVVDESIEPSVATVPPLEGSGDPRPVGRMVTDDGAASDIVVGEAIVVVPNEAAVDDLRERSDIEVVDVDLDPDAAPEDGIDVLVRATDIDSMDISAAGDAFDFVDPDLSGVITVDSPATAATAIVLGRLWNETDYEFLLNRVPTGHDVEDGQLLEAYQQELNAFEWPYVRSTAAQEVGLDTAWQMLYHHGKTQNRVTVLVIDKGFVRNPDFPENARIRKGDWGKADDWLCTNDTPCPYHGTQVALTIAGWHDNNWGTAGVAAPWVHLVVMPAQGGTYSTLKQARKVIKEENVDVVNMSYGSLANSQPTLTRWYTDRTFKLMRQRHGTIAFSSAGNEGKDVDSQSALYLPCASTEVICVGGMGVDTTEKAGSSNYGTERDNRSVEIYGPYCLYVYEEPGSATNGDLKQRCGTSYSSPFVAGVAALLRVADPDISVDGIEGILYSTAHLGDLGPLATGHLRRIDAHMAVAAALGVTWTQPTVSIESGGGSYPVDEVISLSGSAHSYTGEALPIRWHSNIDGWLNENPSFSPIGASLSPGEHLIQATAIDRRGMSGVDSVVIEFENEPPIVTITSPDDGDTLYEGSPLYLGAYTHDPDPFSNTALEDEDVIWRIRDTGGNVVWEDDGHFRVTALNPGAYEVTLTGTDRHGLSATDTIDITVLELEDGWVPPSASITDPPSDLFLHVGNNTVTVDLAGIAKGVDGDAIAGTRFRWTAEDETGYSFEICVGSNFPGQGGGDGPVIGIPLDCSETSAEFGLAPGAVGRTGWTVKLEAVDSQGVPISAVRHIEVTFATG